MIRAEEAKVAMSFVPGVTADTVRAMEEAGLEARDFMSMPERELAAALGGERVHASDRDEAMTRARAEAQFMERHGITALYVGDDDYPFLVRETPDAPVVLYCLGDPELSSPHSVNFVGTRKCTQYGLQWCARIISDLAGYFPDLLVVSGLAYGIDSAAHRAALESGVRTAAVVAHGLDTLYPSGNRDLARQILKNGGTIVTEYPSGTTPFPRRFLERNRIVAAMCEMTMVVESAIKGGAMSTANTAFSYGREVGALPGRASDETSGGCNLLIQRNKASLITSAADILLLLGWEPAGAHVEARQRNLFPELEGDSALIYETLKFRSEPQSVDALHQATGMAVPALMAALTELEFDGIIVRLPGNRFAIS